MLKMHQSKDIHPEISDNGAAGKFFAAIKAVEGRRRAYLTVIWALLSMSRALFRPKIKSRGLLA